MRCRQAVAAKACGWQRRAAQESASKSLKRGESSLALLVPAEGKNNRLAAKECTAANDRRANPRRAYAQMLASNEEAGPFLARG